MALPGTFAPWPHPGRTGPQPDPARARAARARAAAVRYSAAMSRRIRQSAPRVRPWLRIALLPVLLAACAQWSLQAHAAAADAPAQVRVLAFEGAVGPATSDYIIRNLQAAEADRAALFVIRMDTPGGLDSAMREIIKAILDADVPVATWVAPGGSRAASAGTYILYASHIAAMAPATNLGAATPVSIGGGGGPGPSPFPGGGGDAKSGDDTNNTDDAADAGAGADAAQAPPASARDRPAPGSASERKAINDAVAYIRGLAELRGRNADWAEAAVRGAESLPASAALERNVIDFIAADLDALLAAVDGRSVTLERGETTLDLADADVTHIEMDWRSEFLALITNPNIAYILMMLGFYGLILEFYNPGLGIPGVTGVICLLLAFYSLQMLPVSYVGVALIGVGIALMIAETLVPSFGVLGIGGAVALAFGSVMLMDSDLPAYQISLPLIAAFVISSAAIFIFTVGAALRARHNPIVSGREAMIGAEALATEDFRPLDRGIAERSEAHAPATKVPDASDGAPATSGWRGHVRLMGEVWQAHSDTPIRRGEALQVTALRGLVVDVEPRSPGEAAADGAASRQG